MFISLPYIVGKINYSSGLNYVAYISNDQAPKVRFDQKGRHRKLKYLPPDRRFRWHFFVRIGSCDLKNTRINHTFFTRIGYL